MLLFLHQRKKRRWRKLTDSLCFYYTWKCKASFLFTFNYKAIYMTQPGISWGRKYNSIGRGSEYLGTIQGCNQKCGRKGMGGREGIYTWDLTELVQALELHSPHRARALHPNVSSSSDPCTCLGWIIAPKKLLDRKGHKQEKTPKMSSQMEMTAHLRRSSLMEENQQV